MKSVFIAGSRKFYIEIENLVQKLENKNIKVAAAGKWNKGQEDTPESEKNALLNAFKKIDEFDIVYVFSKDGYVGKTVAMEIAYAYARNKIIISSHEIEEMSANVLIKNISSPDNLIEFCIEK